MEEQSKNIDPTPTGFELLHNPSLNKGTAFTDEERNKLGLRGLLPPRVFTQQEQLHRVLENFSRKTSSLEKYIFLMSLLDRNERLFYRFVTEYIEMAMPIIYTPTVGEACRQYAHIFRRARGMYVSIRHRGYIKDVLRNWPQRNVRVVVVTDGERILGLGDLGANGMGIPVGKLALYTACAGIPPKSTLPILLDVGTNNEVLLEDPLYMGTQQHRLTGKPYEDFVDEFVWALREVYPDCVLQFEDFGNHNAFALLHQYRDRICTFNDDIQGTAAVTAAGIFSALRLTKESLEDQRILFFGAGEAALGIADLLVHAMGRSGIDAESARKRCWLLDSRGLVVKGRERVSEEKARYAHDFPDAKTLAEAVDALKPTALIGVSGQPQTFTKEIVERMAALNERPIVFALSNPTSQSECTATQAYEWSRGRAIFASGSPFDPVVFEGHTLVPGQGNNAYVFPGIGLGVMASRATRVTDDMFLAAAQSLASQVEESSLNLGRVYPPLSDIQNVSLKIAVEVFKTATEAGLARTPIPKDLPAYIASLRYDPTYPMYV
ncbi:MAG TPA: NAD-dependent malic enzyme [Rhodothermales bacterium]|nr:NAD-dependent malic enzyme [Rhodothermales bacterium]